MKKRISYNVPKYVGVAESEKKISENSEMIVMPASYVKNNFPAKARSRHKTTILPSHRVIFQYYRDQNFKNLGKAIRKTGVYSENVASRVDRITKSKSWQALMDEQLPEELLAKTHAEVLQKRSYRKITDEDGNTFEVDAGPDSIAVKGLEMAYKLRGSFREQKAPQASTVMYNLFYKPEVREHMRTFEDSLKQTLINEVARKNQRDVAVEAEYTVDSDEAGEVGTDGEGDE